MFGGTRLIAIRSGDAVSYAAARQKAKASNAQINRELQILKRILSLAARHGKLPSRPHIALLQEHNVRTGFFDATQVEAVCEHLEAEIADAVAFAFTRGASRPRFCLWSGARWTFVADEVRLDAGTTKNREGRVFPLTDDLRKLLKRRHASHKKLAKGGHIEPHVFWRIVAECRRGAKKPRPIVRFDKQWKAACKAAGLPGKIPHDLRRSAVRNFVRRGISEHTAMKLSGHKTASVFRRYDIVSPDDLRDAARKLDRTDVRLKQKA